MSEIVHFAMFIIVVGFFISPIFFVAPLLIVVGTPFVWLWPRLNRAEPYFEAVWRRYRGIWDYICLLAGLV